MLQARILDQIAISYSRGSSHGQGGSLQLRPSWKGLTADSWRQIAFPATGAERLRAYTSGSFDGDLLLLLDRDYASMLAPMIFDNKAFPPEWSEGKIAGLCAADCTHCGKCADTLKRVLKSAPAQPA